MSENVQNIQQSHKIITKAMKNWKVILSTGRQILAEVKIQGYFPRRLTVATTIRYSNKVTQLHT